MKTGISFATLVTSLIIYKIISYYISKGIRIEQLQKRTGIIKSIFKFIIIAVLVIILVYVWGFEIQNLWVITTSVLALLAIGLIAVWSLLSNIIAALLLFFTRPFKIGDYIQIIPENIEGRVIEVSSMFTSLKNDKGDEINIPNNLLFQRIIKTVKSPK